MFILSSRTSSILESLHLYIGWVMLEFSLGWSADGQSRVLKVPTLVAEGDIGSPIVSFNVIEQFLKGSGVPMIECVREAMSLNKVNAEALVNF